MANYTTLLVLSLIALTMATIGHCSWISGGAPPPASVGGDVDLGYVNELIDELAPGPNGESTKEKGGPASGPGPAGDFMIQGKRAIWEGFGGVGGDFINQGKASVTPNTETFIIQGKVYCDPCRIQFPTKLSFPLRGVKIVLACHKENSDVETYRVEGESDENGKYLIKAVGDHAEEICEVSVSQSPEINCPDLMDDENHVRVSLTTKHGIKGRARFANPLGFMAEVADPRCKQALDELGFTGI